VLEVDAPPTSPPTGDAAGAALPVTVDLADPDLAADVAVHVESVLGWQVVRPGPHLPARLRLADAPGDRGASGGVPTVVVRRTADPQAARAARAAGALDVLAWPADAGRLAGLVPADASPAPEGPVLALTGAGRAVGTTTVALALGALLAWRGRPATVVTDVAGARLAGRRAGAVCGPVAGVPGLQVATDVATALGSRAAPVGTAGRPHALVVDRGAGRRAQVLVARPDRALAEALGSRAAGSAAVVTVGEGGLRAAEVARVLGDRLHVALPWSFRVARAGVLGRVPSALPGRHLAALEPVAALVRADAGPAGVAA
jgi:hypothetical protein